MQVQPRCVCRGQQGTLCGALGPRRDPARRVHCNDRAVLWRKPPHRIWPLYPYISFPHLYRGVAEWEAHHRCVWDGRAPWSGFVIEDALRKSEPSDFKGQHFGSFTPFVSIYKFVIFLLVETLFVFLLYYYFYPPFVLSQARKVTSA